jgi:hypothetical protein
MSAQGMAAARAGDRQSRAGMIENWPGAGKFIGVPGVVRLRVLGVIAWGRGSMIDER